MTLHRLIALREKLERELAQITANLHATNGAIQILNQLIEEEADTKEVANAEVEQQYTT